MNKKSNKKIVVTLQDVIEVTQKGFERIDKRFDDLEEKLTNKIDDVEQKLSDKIDKVDYKVSGLSGRVEVLEDIVRVIKTKLAIK